MSSGKKPEMKPPPSRVSVDDRLKALDSVATFAQAAARDDAVNAGLNMAESTPVASEPVEEGEGADIAIGVTLRGGKKREKAKAVKALIPLSAELNNRIENALDHVPRLKKQGLILAAIEHYLTKIEKAIETSRKPGTTH